MLCVLNPKSNADHYFYVHVFTETLYDHEVPPHLQKLSNDDNVSFLATVEELKAAEVHVCTLYNNYVMVMLYS